MNCINCNIEMKTVKMVGSLAGLQVYLAYKKKGLLEDEKRSEIECLVCPKCGRLEMKAKTPEVFA